MKFTKLIITLVFLRVDSDDDHSVIFVGVRKGWEGGERGVREGGGHRIRSIQNDQQAIRDSSVIFVAPYWSYRISCLKVQLAPLAQGADSEK